MSSGFPDITQCLSLMEEQAMLPNIRHHSFVVARVSWVLVEGLVQHDPRLPVLPDRELVVAGALLHDIAKTKCLHNGCDHARIGAEFCEGLGYPEIARIVAEHVLLPDKDPARWELGHFTASEIINYADKRVRHEEIVSLEERLAYILERYGAGDPARELRIRDNFVRCRELETSLFSLSPVFSCTPDPAGSGTAGGRSGRIVFRTVGRGICRSGSGREPGRFPGVRAMTD
jgi:uncharacterized protein